MLTVFVTALVLAMLYAAVMLAAPRGRLDFPSTSLAAWLHRRSDRRSPGQGNRS